MKILFFSFIVLFSSSICAVDVHVFSEKNKDSFNKTKIGNSSAKYDVDVVNKINHKKVTYREVLSFFDKHGLDKDKLDTLDRDLLYMNINILNKDKFINKYKKIYTETKLSKAWNDLH